MSYAATGLLAIVILLITNQDILWKGHEKEAPAHRAYRFFLWSVLVYYITDTLWGALETAGLYRLLYADTVLYFIAVAVEVLLWTRYVVLYLERRGDFGKLLPAVGQVFLAFDIAMLAVNFFVPVFFWFDANGDYHAGSVRYLTLGIQILLFLLTSVYTFLLLPRQERDERPRYWAIGLFGLTMTVLVSVQIYYPLLPLYSVGCMVGTCLLHAFVVEGEKEAARRELENSLRREQAQMRELGSARSLAYTDSLTGVKSKHAYVEKETLLDQHIADHTAAAFGLVVFDLNGLKQINDTQGHEAGDRYIVAACRMICRRFIHSPVYRIGGDEFVAVLEGSDYQEREALLSAFERQITENLHTDSPVVASGMAEYYPGRDNSYRAIFARADKNMYRRKRELKESQGM